MKLITIGTILLCLLCWAIPINVLAKTTQPQEQLIVFPNYEKHREVFEVSKSVEETNNVKPIKPKPTTAKVIIPSPKGTYNGRHYSKAEVEALIRQYSNQYGVNPATATCIAFRESGYNQFSKNKSSTASGVFQYVRSTWAGTDEGRSGLSVFDADANIKAAIKYMAIHKSTRPWVVASSCPSLIN